MKIQQSHEWRVFSAINGSVIGSPIPVSKEEFELSVRSDHTGSVTVPTAGLSVRLRGKYKSVLRSHRVYLACVNLATGQPDFSGLLLSRREVVEGQLELKLGSFKDYAAHRYLRPQLFNLNTSALGSDVTFTLAGHPVKVVSDAIMAIQNASPGMNIFKPPTSFPVSDYKQVLTGVESVSVQELWDAVQDDPYGGEVMVESYITGIGAEMALHLTLRVPRASKHVSSDVNAPQVVHTVSLDPNDDPDIPVLSYVEDANKTSNAVLTAVLNDDGTTYRFEYFSDAVDGMPILEERLKFDTKMSAADLAAHVTPRLKDSRRPYQTWTLSGARWGSGDRLNWLGDFINIVDDTDELATFTGQSRILAIRTDPMSDVLEFTLMEEREVYPAIPSRNNPLTGLTDKNDDKNNWNPGTGFPTVPEVPVVPPVPTIPPIDPGAGNSGDDIEPTLYPSDISFARTIGMDYVFVPGGVEESHPDADTIISGQAVYIPRNWTGGNTCNWAEHIYGFARSIDGEQNTQPGSDRFYTPKVKTFNYGSIGRAKLKFGFVPYKWEDAGGVDEGALEESYGIDNDKLGIPSGVWRYRTIQRFGAFTVAARLHLYSQIETHWARFQENENAPVDIAAVTFHSGAIAADIDSDGSLGEWKKAAKFPGTSFPYAHQVTKSGNNVFMVTESSASPDAIIDGTYEYIDSSGYTNLQAPLPNMVTNPSNRGVFSMNFNGRMGTAEGWVELPQSPLMTAEFTTQDGKVHKSIPQSAKAHAYRGYLWVTSAWMGHKNDPNLWRIAIDDNAKARAGAQWENMGEFILSSESMSPTKAQSVVTNAHFVTANGRDGFNTRRLAQNGTLEELKVLKFPDGQSNHPPLGNNPISQHSASEPMVNDRYVYMQVGAQPAGSSWASTKLYLEFADVKPTPRYYFPRDKFVKFYGVYERYIDKPDEYWGDGTAGSALNKFPLNPSAPAPRTPDWVQEDGSVDVDPDGDPELGTGENGSGAWVHGTEDRTNAGGSIPTGQYNPDEHTSGSDDGALETGSGDRAGDGTSFSYNTWGASRDPDDFGGLDNSLVPGTQNVRLSPGVRAGDVAVILFYVAAQLHARVEDGDLYRSGDEWGYSYRPNANNKSVLSCHSSGTAFDWNATRHPNKESGTFSPEQVAEIRKILAEVDGCVRWGGDFKKTKDEMHFEIVASEADVKATADRLRAVK